MIKLWTHIIYVKKFVGGMSLDDPTKKKVLRTLKKVYLEATKIIMRIQSIEWKNFNDTETLLKK